MSGRGYAEKLVLAILKHGEDADVQKWVAGVQFPVLIISGTVKCVYRMGQMARLESGVIVDLDPTKITGVEWIDLENQVDEKMKAAAEELIDDYLSPAEKRMMEEQADASPESLVVEEKPALKLD